jgi:hypothetical protein
MGTVSVPLRREFQMILETERPEIPHEPGRGVPTDVTDPDQEDDGRDGGDQS